MLAQFCGYGRDLFADNLSQLQSPRRGCSPSAKGSTRATISPKPLGRCIKGLPINFIGNVEGRDIFSGLADVIICDGFVGNVVLKVSEGLVDMIKSMLRESLEATVTRKIGYVLSRAAYKEFRKRVDYSEFGGIPLLGVKGANIMCHGRSNANAIKNAIRVAAEFAAGQRAEKDRRRSSRAAS